MALRKFLYIDDTADGAATEQESTDEAEFGKVSLSGISGVAIDAGSASIINVPTPTADHHAVNKAYADSIAQGLDPKPAVRAASTSDISSLSGPQTIDGVSCIAGDRVLLMGQTSGNGAIDNGIWVVQSGAWTRPADFATGDHCASAFTFVQEGSTFADEGYVCTTDPPNDIIDTHANNWTQFSGAGTISAGDGLTKTGNVLDVNAGDGIEIVSDYVTVDLATDPGLEFTGTTPNAELRAKVDPSGGLERVAAGLGVKLDGTTLQKGASGLKVLGVPAAGTWEIGGVATGSTVTAPNLDELTDGSETTLHSHPTSEALQELLTANESCNKGDPVAWSNVADKFNQGDANNTPDSRIFGVVLANVAGDGTALVVRRGVAPDVLSGATAGAPYWLAAGGGLTSSIPTGTGNRIIRIGYAKNSTDLEVLISDSGRRG